MKVRMKTTFECTWPLGSGHCVRSHHANVINIVSTEYFRKELSFNTVCCCIKNSSLLTMLQLWMPKKAMYFNMHLINLILFTRNYDNAHAHGGAASDAWYPNIPVDSSAARIPLPGATIFWAMSLSSFFCSGLRNGYAWGMVTKKKTNGMSWFCQISGKIKHATCEWIYQEMTRNKIYKNVKCFN